MHRTRIVLRQFFSTFKPKSPSPSQTDKIKELFGEVQDCTVTDPNLLVSLQKRLINKKQKQIQQNQRIRNYHQYEYYRGQDYIEKIPYTGPYTLKDQLCTLEEKKRQGIEQLKPIANHVERARLIREKISAYHDKQRKYQIEQFQKYLSNYPGTTKGPRPEDDWQAYRQYGLKKIPKILADQLNHQRALKNLTFDEDDQEDQEAIKERANINAPSYLLSYMAKDRELMDMNTDQKEQKQGQQTASQYSDPQIIQVLPTEVPLMPTIHFQDYQQFMMHWMSWINFRNHYVTHNMASNMKKLQERFEQLCKTLNDSSEEYVQLPRNIPSLYRYYKCLPKSLQDHPGMKDIYLGLEYSSPDFTYEEKEDALNYTCPWLLPFDAISLKVLTDYTERSRTKLTPFLQEKMFTISPEFTWDLHLFLDQIRKQELRGEAVNQNKEARNPEPPEVHKIWEEGAPNLPVDYYQNDDGFWDSIISEKLKRYDEFKPMLKTRKHFTH